MMNSHKYCYLNKANILILIMIVSSLLASCLKNNSSNNIAAMDSGYNKELAISDNSKFPPLPDDISYIDFLLVKEINKRYNLVKNCFQKNSSTIYYPEISGLEYAIIEKTVKAIIYDAAVFYYSEEWPNVLEVDYTIMYNSNRLISLCFKGYQYYENALHPINNYRSINVDISTGEEILLSDLYSVDRDFYLAIIQYNCVGAEEFGDGYENDAKKLLTKEIKEGLWDNSENLIHIYLTSDKLGVIFGLPHALGSNIIFEAPYSDLKDWEI